MIDFDTFEMYDNANQAIISFVHENFGVYELLDVMGPLTDEQIELNVYLNDQYPVYDSIESIAVGLDIDGEYLEAYSTTWKHYSEWDDVVIVLHKDGLYMSLEWL